MIATIITFHSVPNYGAVLQAYALQETLKRYFEQVYILDYRPKRLINEYALINTYSFKSIIFSCLSAFPFWVKQKNFKRFVKQYVSLSVQRYTAIEEIKDLKTDYFFLGSDQIWNPDITGGFDSVYFANFQKRNDSKILSYAASLGKNEFDKEEMHDFALLLQGVDVLSVREAQAGELIKKHLQREVAICLDPTLLLSQERWGKLLKPVKYSKYVLMYSLNGYEDTVNVANAISTYLNIQIIEISGRRKPVFSSKHKALYSVGPDDFLSLIRAAEFVVTDSFHGTAFSIVFHKKFVTIPHKSRGGRMSNLLSKLSLLDRMTNRVNSLFVDKQIDWEKVDEQLRDEQIISLNYIEKNI